MKITNKIELINFLIQKNNYNSYLEIGVAKGDTFKQVQIQEKKCVDPVKKFNLLDYEMTSDEFFAINHQKFDIIFIDGLHLEEQCIKDIHNSLSILNPDGTIIVHDCLPPSEEYTDPNRNGKKSGPWWGTTFRAIIDLRYKNPELQINVINSFCGCGIIKKGFEKQVIYDKVPIEIAKTFSYYKKNQKQLMNVITIEEFQKIQ
jgi:hypothetical protein